MVSKMNPIKVFQNPESLHKIEIDSPKFEYITNEAGSYYFHTIGPSIGTTSYNNGKMNISGNATMNQMKLTLEVDDSPDKLTDLGEREQATNDVIENGEYDIDTFVCERGKLFTFIDLSFLLYFVKRGEVSVTIELQAKLDNTHIKGNMTPINNQAIDDSLFEFNIEGYTYGI